MVLSISHEIWPVAAEDASTGLARHTGRSTNTSTSSCSQITGCSHNRTASTIDAIEVVRAKPDREDRDCSQGQRRTHRPASDRESQAGHDQAPSAGRSCTSGWRRSRRACQATETASQCSRQLARSRDPRRVRHRSSISPLMSSAGSGATARWIEPDRKARDTVAGRRWGHGSGTSPSPAHRRCIVPHSALRSARPRFVTAWSRLARPPRAADGSPRRELSQPFHARRSSVM